MKENMRRWAVPSILVGIICLLGMGPSGLLRAQSAAPAGGPSAMDAAVAQQRLALSAMQEALAKQRSSVQMQSSKQEAGGFFVLSPPAAMERATAYTTPSADCDPLPAAEIDSLVGKAASRVGISEDLLRGVMKQESGFRPCAVSTKGAMGLMQLMPATADQFGVKDPFDANKNVDAGARLLKQLLVRFGGDISLALGAYNAGPARVDAAAGVPAIPETLDYIRRVLPILPIK